jgi:hypothetical protein
MKWFGLLISIGWSLFALFLIASFYFPSTIGKLLSGSGTSIALWPLSLVLGTPVFLMMLIQRSGRIDVTKWFGRLILIGWSLLALFTIAGFSFPKLMHRLFGWFAPFLVLWPLSLILGTGVFVVMLIYRTSIERTTK